METKTVELGDSGVIGCFFWLWWNGLQGEYPCDHFASRWPHGRPPNGYESP